MKDGFIILTLSTLVLGSSGLQATAEQGVNQLSAAPVLGTPQQPTAQPSSGDGAASSPQTQAPSQPTSYTVEQVEGLVTDYEGKTGDHDTFAFEKGAFQAVKSLANSIPAIAQKKFSEFNKDSSTKQKYDLVVQQLQAIINELNTANGKPVDSITPTQVVQVQNQLAQTPSSEQNAGTQPSTTPVPPVTPTPPPSSNPPSVAQPPVVVPQAGSNPPPPPPSSPPLIAGTGTVPVITPTPVAENSKILTDAKVALKPAPALAPKPVASGGTPPEGWDKMSIKQKADALKNQGIKK